jgi:ATPase subunit of ABC transporter with duplicated ATPase domains
LALSLILKRVTKRYADHLIFENASLELHAGDRVGLLGRNGSGKTTLMKLLTKLEQPDAGEVGASGRLAYLEQRSELEAGSLREIVLPAHHRQLKAELEIAQQNLEIPSTENLECFAIAEESFRLAGGYDIEARAESILAGLGLNGEFSSRALSSGQERRALLARLLIEPSDFYLLDEPTNHLDLESLVWLENFVNNSEAGFLIVSHDRAFLDATVTRCYELERYKLSEYPGNYSEAMATKKAIQENQLNDYLAHQRKVTALEIEATGIRQYAASAGKFDHRKKTWGHTMQAKNKAENVSRTLANRAKALEKRIEHMGELEKPFEENFMTRIKLGLVNHGPNEVLTLENLKLERGEKLILEGLNLHLRRGERLALIGVNGGGKSTLLKAILGQLPISSGKILTGVGLNIYWAGQNTEELYEHETLKDALLAANSDLETRELFALLASLGLPKDPTRAITTLSGGQRTRLSLARLSVTKAHLLILDEPTNNLDIDAIQALEKLLLEFNGTIIFASHDRRLLENIASKTLEIPSLKLEVRD